MSFEFSHCLAEPITHPLVSYTSPPQTPPLPPSLSITNPVLSIAILEIHDTIQGGKTSFNMENPNAVCGDIEVRVVQAMRSGAPSAKASMLPSLGMAS